MVPLKAVYMQTDLERLSSLFDVPLKYSPSFVDMMTKGTLRAMRVLTAVRLYCSL